MSSLEMICTLRQRLLTGIENRDVEELNRLNETFAVLREMVSVSSQVNLLEILTDLEYAAGYAAIGAITRALMLIPAEDAIRANFAGNSAAV